MDSGLNQGWPATGEVTAIVRSAECAGCASAWLSQDPLRRGKLIKTAFSPEEVALAGQLTRFPETAAEIAKRVGMDEADVTVLCESLKPRRLEFLAVQK
jgi:hypothetical protein